VYDAQNRLISIHSLPDDVTTTYTYDAVGNLIQTTTSDGAGNNARIQTRRYDLQGRLIGELSGEGSAVLATLVDPTQTQIAAVGQNYGIRLASAAAGRRISPPPPDGPNGPGRTTLFYYDADGRLTASINALGEVVGYQYDVFGGLTTTTAYAT